VTRDAGAGAAAVSGRRSNRGNTTSSELRDAFNYTSVVSTWNNGNHIGAGGGGSGATTAAAAQSSASVPASSPA